MVSEGSSSSATQNYDVFLSFRGADTRYSFTDHLYNALVNAKIDTFRDNEEMEMGGVLRPELESAIKSSKASIVVLSKNYASSSWCLNELVLITDLHRASKQIVIPVFYHVEPTNVRKQKDTFEVAMAEHRQKMANEQDAEKQSEMVDNMKKWIKALDAVAAIKGMDIKDRSETELIEEIVKDIHRRLRISSKITQPQFFGMDNHINYITSWLKDASSHKADILTILGMGGIGKTSLAKHVYDLHYHEFEKSKFIENISRKCAKFNGVLKLQKQLHGGISKPSSVEVYDEDEYVPMIEKALAKKKVFLVLDDIDSINQLNALLGSKGLYPGSKVIITTKDAKLTKKCALFNPNVEPKHIEYLLQGLNKTESRLLLCFHASVSNDPKTGYTEVLDKLVNYCEGHPLALKLLGESLCEQAVPFWEDVIESLEKEYGSPVNNILKMSFNALPFESDKELFKHIACFFVGIDRYYTETILKACNIKTSHAFPNLINRCLLSIEGNKLMMHQLLQDMGRSLVHEESPKKPWKRSRLWRDEESSHVLNKKKGTENVIGLTLDARKLENERSFKLETDALSGMNELMLLQLNFVEAMNGSYDKFPKKIRWLCMHGFHLKSIPLDLPMKSLVALDLSYSNIESFDICYDNRQQSQKGKELIGSSSKDKGLLGSLKILTLSSCEKLQSVGGFVEIRALERLIVTGCSELVEVSDTIEACIALVFIDLSGCNKLEQLPRTIGKLEKVKTLLLVGCQFGGLHYEVMEVHMGSSVNNISINTATPSSAIVRPIPRVSEFLMFLPKSLVMLWLSINPLYTKSFPMDFSYLSELKELCLNDTPIIVMPDCVRSLPQLEVLRMAGCRNLMSIERPPPKLRFLNILSVFGELQRVVFDPEMSPLRLGILPQQIVVPCDIEGILKIQRMTYVEEKVLDSLGWTNPDFPYDKCMETFFAGKKPKESKIKMCYEFGIFTTYYTGKEMPNWISCRSKGPSISFTVQPSPNNIRGLNLCFVQMIEYSPPPYELVDSPIFKITNETKNLTWIYKCFNNSLRVDGECLVYLSHWMFGTNEMEAGDHVIITGTVGVGLTKECGVSFVYDDGKRDGEQDPLSYYMSWNHIIGGDLTGFQLKTGEYILDFGGYEREDIAITGFFDKFVKEGAVYQEEQVWFRALSKKKSGIVGHTYEDEDNGGAIGNEENSHGCKDNLPRFELSQLEIAECFYHGTEENVEIHWPLPTLTELDYDEDDAEVDKMTSSEPSSLFQRDESLRFGTTSTATGPSNLDEDLGDVPSLQRNVGASTQNIDRVSGPSPKNNIHDPSSGPSIQSSALDRFNIPKSSRKKRLKKSAVNVIQDLEEPLSEEEDGNLRSRSRPRRRLMDVEQILKFPAYDEKEVHIDKDKAIDVTGGCPDSSFTGYGPLNTLFVTPSEVSCPEGTLVVNVDKGKAIAATEGTSESNKQRSWGGTAAIDIFTKHVWFIEQAKKMASVAHDITQMQDGYIESQNKMKALEEENSVLNNRLSQAEVAWVKAESRWEHSEAQRADANQKMLLLEASNSELASRLELLESEKKQLVERVGVLQAADAERVGQLEVSIEGLNACRADLEWVLRKGLPRCFDKVLESEAFLEAYKRVRKACHNYGREVGCKLMRDRFQLAVPDAELPGYKADTEREVTEACSSFAETNYVATAGLAELSVDALRAFCWSSDDESD